ncbi:hypothetical protein LTR81_028014 [Elasticomyces elasticus]
MDSIPSCDHGSMITTTRSKREARKLVDESEIVEVKPMSEDKAEALLERKLGRPSPDNRHLARALDCIPLAITQAAAYIQETEAANIGEGTPQSPVQQYCEQMQRSRKSRISLLQQHIPLPDRDEEASNSVLLTWQISFEHIYTTTRSAAELLSLMSFCDRLAIPESLLRADGEGTERSDGRSDFDEDVITLRSFSFISNATNARTWEMHRLVQDATQVWLENHRRRIEVLERFVHRLYRSFPTGEFENWSVCQLLFPHAKSAAAHQPASKRALTEWALVMYNCAWYTNEQGNSVDALAMATSSMTIRSEQLGEESEPTLWSRGMLAWAYRNQGRWKEAEELEVEVMETRVRVLGGEHPDTLTSISNLTTTFMY